MNPSRIVGVIAGMVLALTVAATPADASPAGAGPRPSPVGCSGKATVYRFDFTKQAQDAGRVIRVRGTVKVGNRTVRRMAFRLLPDSQTRRHVKVYPGRDRRVTFSIRGATVTDAIIEAVGPCRPPAS